jgi:competence protein ComEA
MERRHRDLLWAVGAVLLFMSVLLGWWVYSRARQGPPMSVTGLVGQAAANAAPSIPDGAPAPAPSAAPPATAKPTALRVHVVGAVRTPNVYTLPATARVIDAVNMAGGATADADVERVNMADFLKDGEQLRIPRKSDAPPRPVAARSEPVTRPAPAARSVPRPPAVAAYRSEARYPRDEVTSPDPAPGASSVTPSAAASAGGKVNLNTATLADLDTLPGVGPATATAIIEYRRQHGPFLRIEDVMEVRGIGEKKFEAMKDRLVVK